MGGVDALLRPWVDPASRTWWVAVAASVALAMAVGLLRGVGAARAAREALGVAGWTHPSSRVDLAIYVIRRAVAAAGWTAAGLSSHWLAVRLALALDHTFGPPSFTPPVLVAGVSASVLGFLASDASRFAVHWALHRVPWLWAFHQVHHSAEVMTPLTFHRIHPVEAFLYGVRGSCVTALVAGSLYWAFRGLGAEWTVLGVGGLGLSANLISGNLRHSHFAWRWGRLEAWLLSPAQHQLHHARDGRGANLGTWLAIWDHLAGTWAPSTGAVLSFGLDPAWQNHDPHRPLDAMIGPFRALLGRAGRGQGTR
jgi:sterol desaturase/sphingolipid hydroxylase (fatty acid hydroxylase superfamily)